MTSNDRVRTVKIKAFTSINLNYVDKASTLWQSMSKYSSSIEIHTFIVEPGLSMASNLEICEQLNSTGILGEVHSIFDLEENWMEILQDRSVVEACTSIKASGAKFLLDMKSDVVLYFDPDMLIMASLDELLDQVSGAAFSLTPHLLNPPKSELGIAWNEIGGSMKYGIFNLGFFGVTNSPEGISILNWWNSRLITYCYARPEEGIFTDQKWFDNAPAYFPDCNILRNPGYNVAPWNIEERFLTLQDDLFFANDAALVFFHFSSFDKPELIGMLKRFDKSKLSLELLDLYKKELALQRNYNLDFSRFVNGKPQRHGKESSAKYKLKLAVLTYSPSIVVRFLVFIKKLIRS